MQSAGGQSPTPRTLVPAVKPSSWLGPWAAWSQWAHRSGGFYSGRVQGSPLALNRSLICRWAAVVFFVLNQSSNIPGANVWKENCWNVFVLLGITGSWFWASCSCLRAVRIISPTSHQCIDTFLSSLFGVLWALFTGPHPWLDVAVEIKIWIHNYTKTSDLSFNERDSRCRLTFSLSSFWHRKNNCLFGHVVQ